MIDHNDSTLGSGGVSQAFVEKRDRQREEFISHDGNRYMLTKINEYDQLLQLPSLYQNPDEVYTLAELKNQFQETLHRKMKVSQLKTLEVNKLD